MLKKYLSWLTIASVAAAMTLSLSSCKDDDDPTLPQVTVKAGTAGETSLSFTVTPKDATAVAYAVIKKGEVLPVDAAELFSVGKAGENAEKEYTETGLTAETAYVIVVAAQNEGAYSALNKIEMITAELGSGVTVTLTPGEPTGRTLSFTLKTSENAEMAAYVCIEKGETVPTADEIFNNGMVAESGENLYTVEDLKEKTDYVIAAAATSHDFLSPVATIEMTTIEIPAEDFAVTNVAAFYYGNTITGETGTGLFYLNLNNITWEGGYAQSAGLMFRLSMHAAAAADPKNATLPAGTYTFDPASTNAAGTIDAEITDWAETDAEGRGVDQGKFTDAVVTVEHSGATYNVVAILYLDNGKKIKATWSGPIVWEDMVNVYATGQVAIASYYGKDEVYNPDSDNWLIQIADKSEEPTWIMTIDLYSQIAPDWRHPIIANGIYQPDTESTYEAGLYTPGQLFFGIFPIGTYYQDGNGALFCTEGPLTISRNGDSYTISGEFTTEKGQGVKVSYTGPIAITMNYSPEFEGDLLDIPFSLVYKGQGTYTPAGEDGLHNYYVRLSDVEMDDTGKPVSGGAGNLLCLDFYTTAGPGAGDIIIPNGTYNVAEDAADLTCGTEYTFMFHYDADGIKYTETLASGTATVNRGPGGYDIDVDFTTKGGHRITGSYNGAIPLVLAEEAPSLAGKALYSENAVVGPDGRMHRVQPQVKVRPAVKVQTDGSGRMSNRL